MKLTDRISRERKSSNYRSISQCNNIEMAEEKKKRKTAEIK